MFTAIIYHTKGLFRSNMMQNCLFFSKGNVLSWLFLTVLWYVNAKTIWGNEVQNISRHDDFCQPLTTYAASILTHSWSFSGGSRLFWNQVCILPLFYSLQFAFYPQLALYPRSAVCRLGVKSAFSFGLTLIILDKWLWIYENNVCNNKGFDMKWTLLEYQWK